MRDVMRPCGVDGSTVRPMFAPGKGKNARRQHARWYVCERGHKLYRKRDAR